MRVSSRVYTHAIATHRRTNVHATDDSRGRFDSRDLSSTQLWHDVMNDDMSCRGTVLLYLVVGVYWLASMAQPIISCIDVKVPS